jgi:hypothetical protein
MGCDVGVVCAYPARHCPPVVHPDFSTQQTWRPSGAAFLRWYGWRGRTPGFVQLRALRLSHQQVNAPKLLVRIWRFETSAADSDGVIGIYLSGGDKMFLREKDDADQDENPGGNG